MVQSLFEPEVGEVVGDQLVAQEGGELFVLLQKRVLEVGAEDVMAVLNAIDDGGQLAAHPAVQTVERRRPCRCPSPYWTCRPRRFPARRSSGATARKLPPYRARTRCARRVPNSEYP